MNIDTCLAAFLEGAKAIIVDGVAHSRADDPHKFATLVADFDAAARRRLVVDYLAGGQIRIALELSDETRTVEVFATTVQGGPTDPSSSTH